MLSREAAIKQLRYLEARDSPLPSQGIQGASVIAGQLTSNLRRDLYCVIVPHFNSYFPMSPAVAGNMLSLFPGEGNMLAVISRDNAKPRSRLVQPPGGHA